MRKLLSIIDRFLAVIPARWSIDPANDSFPFTANRYACMEAAEFSGMTDLREETWLGMEELILVINGSLLYPLVTVIATGGVR